jgi:hypothetical protein
MSLSKLTLSFTTAFVMMSAATATHAAAERSSIELGGGLDVTALGSYDLGAALGTGAQRDDLGPATVGVFVAADFPFAETATVGAEGGIAFGGLVKTDERYFGERNMIGSTVTAWARARAKVALRPRLLVGASAGIARLAESTRAGNVRVDTLVAGPTLAVPLGHGFAAELHADLNIPFRASIGDVRSGDPTGTFFAAGLRLAYTFGIGGR